MTALLRLKLTTKDLRVGLHTSVGERQAALALSFLVKNAKGYFRPLYWLLKAFPTTRSVYSCLNILLQLGRRQQSDHCQRAGAVRYDLRYIAPVPHPDCALQVD